MRLFQLNVVGHDRVTKEDERREAAVEWRVTN